MTMAVTSTTEPDANIAARGFDPLQYLDRLHDRVEGDRKTTPFRFRRDMLTDSTSPGGCSFGTVRSRGPL